MKQGQYWIKNATKGHYIDLDNFPRLANSNSETNSIKIKVLNRTQLITPVEGFINNINTFELDQFNWSAYPLNPIEPFSQFPFKNNLTK
jgi:hypothetical protein